MPIISGGSGGGTAGALISKIYSNKPAANITRANVAIGAFSTAWQVTGVVVGAAQNVRLTMSAYINTSGSNDRILALFRGASQLVSWNDINNIAGNGKVVHATWIDALPGAGTYTYEIQGAALTAGTLTVYQQSPTTDVTGGGSILVAEVYTP